MFYFEMIAPITGDAIYRREGDQGVVEHCIITNTDARERQLQVLDRGR